MQNSRTNKNRSKRNRTRSFNSIFNKECNLNDFKKLKERNLFLEEELNWYIKENDILNYNIKDLNNKLSQRTTRRYGTRQVSPGSRGNRGRGYLGSSI